MVRGLTSIFCSFIIENYFIKPINDKVGGACEVKMIKKPPLKYLTKQDSDKIIQLIKRIDTILSFDVTLNSNDIMSINKLGRLSLDFTECALMYAKEHPSLLPSYIGVNEFNDNLELMKEVTRITGFVNILSEKLRAISVIAGSEAYRAARVFYANAKVAGKDNEDTMDVILKNLEQRFIRKRKAKTQEAAVEA